MTQILRQSTQIIVRIGPFVDAGDGFTPETGVTLSGADEAELLKANTATTTDISGATWAAITGCDGWYALTLTTSLTDTVGPLDVMVQDDSVCLPVFARFQVIEEAAYDAMYAASAAPATAAGVSAVETDTQDIQSRLPAALSGGNMKVDVLAISTSATAADNLETAGLAYSATRGLAGTALPAAAADAAGGLIISDAGGLDADAQLVTKINSILDDTDLIDDATSGLAKIATDVAAVLVDTAEIGAAGAGLTAINLPNQTMDIVGNITGNLSGSVGSVTAGVTLANDAITAAKFDESTAFPLKADDSGSTAVARTGADGDTLETLSDEIAALSIPSAADIADAVWEEDITDHSGTTDSTAEALSDAGAAGTPPTVEEIRAEIDSNSTQLAAIVADTGELQTDWANGGRLDLILDARASQTSVDDLPTNSELATALGTADDAVLAALAALNNLSSSQAATAVLTTQMTESYAANGVAPTLAQALLAVHQHLMAFDISSTSKTVRKLDGSTQAFVETLDDATTPTALTRA